MNISGKMTALVHELQDQIRSEMIDKVRKALGRGPSNGHPEVTTTNRNVEYRRAVAAKIGEEAATSIAGDTALSCFTGAAPVTAREVATRLEVEMPEARAELGRLVKAKKIKRLGKCRGTRYVLR